jgi:SAM-dependent methyltransferase
MKLGEVFTDRDVARAYRHRPECPPETFSILRDLIVGPRVILDVGAGTGAIARGLVPHVERVDAIDISEAMIDEGRRLPNGSDPRLRWILGSAEEAPLDPPYGLITAGAAVHWFDEERTMPRFAAALAPGARLALSEIEDEPVGDGSWAEELHDITKRYSELKDYRDFVDVLRGLQDEGWFVREGEARTRPVRVSRTISEVIEWQHSKATLSRVRLGARTAAFDEELTAVFRRRRIERVDLDAVGFITWGRPVALR